MLQMIMRILEAMAALVCSVFLEIILHEAGHMIFGLFSGYGFSSFRIGNLMLIRQEGKLRLRKLPIAGTGGQCIMSPPEFISGKIPVFWFNLGGVCFNLASAILFGVLFFLLPRMYFLSPFLFFAAILGLVFALLNGIPLHMGGLDNDGMNALSLGKNEKAMKGFWLQLRINEELSKGVRLKDMPEAWFPKPDWEDMENSMVACMAVFRANRLMDEHAFSEAESYMAQFLEIKSGIPGIYRALCACDRIFIDLLGEEPVLTEKLYTAQLKDFMKQMKTFPSVIRTRYVLALLWEKDLEEAKKWEEKFEKTACTYPYEADVAFERELLELAKQKEKEKNLFIRT